MKPQSYWWVSVLVVVVMAAAITLWMNRPPAPARTALQEPAPAIQPAATVHDVPARDAPTQAEEAVVGTADVEVDTTSEPPVECMESLPTWLAEEPQFASNGIVLSMGFSPGGSSIRIPVPCLGLLAREFSALTPDGVAPLSGDVTRADSKVEWGCAETFRAAALAASRPVVKSNLPILVGAQAQKLLQWVPARRVEGSVDCAPPRQDFMRQRQQLFEFSGRQGRWSLEYWRLPEPKVLAEAAAARAAGKEQNYAPIIHIQVWSRISEDGTCAVNAVSEQDWDRKPVGERPPLSGVFGQLTFKDEDTAEKSWLLFDSPGYEGSGMAAIPLGNDGEKLVPERADWNVYSGC